MSRDSHDYKCIPAVVRGITVAVAVCLVSCSAPASIDCGLDGIGLPHTPEGATELKAKIQSEIQNPDPNNIIWKGTDEDDPAEFDRAIARAISKKHTK
jgi:hypothetical protein